MAKVAVYKMDGAESGQIELNDNIFGVEVNVHVMHEAVVAHLANCRQGTQSAKTRAEVRGGGKKRDTVRREPDVPVRVVSVRLSGSAAVSYLHRSPEIMRRR